MGYIQGEGRNQGILFPVVLDDFVPADHVCRVIDAFVEELVMSELGFERAQAAETGRPGYDPRDLLKLYLYGYLNQIRSSRRLETECRRNVELMWLLGRLYPDHKSAMDMRMKQQPLIPSVQYAEESDLCPEVPRIGGHFEQRLCTCTKQEVEDDLLVLQCNRIQFTRYCGEPL